MEQTAEAENAAPVYPLAEWLEIGWGVSYTRLLLQVFRAGGKSTIAGLFAAWLLYRGPNLRILVLAADEGDPWFIAAEGVVSMALAGNMPDITNGATHYHAAGATLGWAYREKPVAVIGRHIFYKLKI